MKRSLGILGLFILAACGVTVVSSAARTHLLAVVGAVMPQDQVLSATPATSAAARQLENFDLRVKPQLAVESPAEQTNAPTSVFKLQRRQPAALIRRDGSDDAPTRVYSTGQPLSAPSSDNAELIARRFLKENDDLYRLPQADVNGLQVVRRDHTTHNGVTHLTLGQRVNEIEVFQARLTSHINRDGAVVATTGSLIPYASRLVNAAPPRLSAAAALRLAANHAGIELTAAPDQQRLPRGVEQEQAFARGSAFSREAHARLVYFPLAADRLRLAWEFELWVKDSSAVYLVIVDAGRGSLLFRHNLTAHQANPPNPHGLVFDGDSPRPNIPRVSASPAIVERVDRPFHAEPWGGRTIFNVNDPHYDWWAGGAADKLVTNNTSTQQDRDAMANVPDEPRINVPNGFFSFPLDFSLSPADNDDNRRAAQVNLFYQVNRFHDILYAYGFTEAAGNFQRNNFGLGGIGDDYIEADAQDSAAFNNANFSTPPDGRAGRVQMFLWSAAFVGDQRIPVRDGSLDNGVIIHELTHGLSSRLIGNATGLSGIQARGMGEGWSDYFSLALLAKEGDPLDGVYPVGQYVTHNFSRGIRRYPYSTDVNVFPLTFRDVAGSGAVHAVGEIWCAALWEMRAALIGKYGFQEGQRQSLQLVVDGMKLTPNDPGFIDARDAILLADRINNTSANQCLLWAAFAKRGLGESAFSLGVNDLGPQGGFDNPFFCADTPQVRLDKRFYLAGETIRIAAGDRQATGAVSALVTSSVTGDREEMALTADAAQPQRFIASLRIASGLVAPGDGALQASIEARDAIAVTLLNRDGSVSTTVATALLAREATVFSDDVERGNRGWFRVGDWAISDKRSASPSRCYTDSPQENYPNQTTQNWLVSPAADFTGLRDATLAFTHSFDFEDRYDFGVVEYSADGQTWLRAAAFTGRQSEFKQVRIKLPALDDQPVARVRFRIFSDQFENGDGWYVDDIRLTARATGIAGPGNAQLPVMTELTPAFGPPAGGTTVTIMGANFTETADTSVAFDGLPATNVAVINDALITAVVPPHAAGTANVRVTNRLGGSTFVNGFTYYNPDGASLAPTLATIFPAQGTLRGGTLVTLRGANFTPAAKVRFGVREAAVTYHSPDRLSAMTPASQSTGAVEVSVIDKADSAVLPLAYLYNVVAPPVVQWLNPAEGETVYTGGALTIRWRSSGARPLRRHRLTLRTNNGSDTVIAEIGGEAQSYIWRIPASFALAASARIRITAIDEDGLTGEAESGQIALQRRWEASEAGYVISQSSLASDGRYVYVIGGNSISSVLPFTWRFDPQASNPLLEKLAEMLTETSGGEAVFINGKIYLPGGEGKNIDIHNFHQVYDIATDNWEDRQSPDLRVKYYAAVADAARGVYYRTGGTTSTTSAVSGQTAVTVYDAAADRWSDLPPMQTARCGHESALIGSKLYVAGGTGATGGLAAGEVFDFAAQQWSPIASLNRPRAFAASVVATDAQGNPLWIVAGGEDPASRVPLSNVEVYDVRNNRWLTLDGSFNLTQARSQLSGALLNGSFYTFGGLGISPDRRLTPQQANERLKISALELVALQQVPVLSVPETQFCFAGVETGFPITVNALGATSPPMLTATNLPPGARFSAMVPSGDTARGHFQWTPQAADAGRSFTVTFTARVAENSDERTVTLQVVEASPLAVVNAADFRAGTLAPDSMAAAFGANLAARTVTAASLPLPTELAGTMVMVNGVRAPLLYVSPTQINFIVPADLDAGAAVTVVSSPQGRYALNLGTLARSAPAIFTIGMNGQGEAAALATADGVNYQRAPFDVAVDGKPNNLILFGTGLRHTPAGKPFNENGVAEAVSVRIGGQPARVLYAGAQSEFAGLDQLNIELPQSLAGGGPRRVEVVVTVQDVEVNRVGIRIK